MLLMVGLGQQMKQIGICNLKNSKPTSKSMEIASCHMIGLCTIDILNYVVGLVSNELVKVN